MNKGSLMTVFVCSVVTSVCLSFLLWLYVLRYIK